MLSRSARRKTIQGAGIVIIGAVMALAIYHQTEEDHPRRAEAETAISRDNWEKEFFWHECTGWNTDGRTTGFLAGISRMPMEFDDRAADTSDGADGVPTSVLCNYRWYLINGCGAKQYKDFMRLYQYAGTQAYAKLKEYEMLEDPFSHADFQKIRQKDTEMRTAMLLGMVRNGTYMRAYMVSYPKKGGAEVRPEVSTLDLVCDEYGNWRIDTETRIFLQREVYYPIARERYRLLYRLNPMTSDEGELLKR